MVRPVPSDLVIDPDELAASIQENQRQLDAYMVWKARWLREQGIIEVRPSPAARDD